MRLDRLITAVLAGVLFSLVFISTASAQQRYRPAYGPALSPYLHYFRPDTTPLGNHYQFVRPRQMLGRRLSQQDALLRNTRQEVGNLEEAMRRGPTDGLLRPSGFGPTGHATSFLNYSRYYPGAGGGRR
jgi:hypothetical protein